MVVEPRVQGFRPIPYKRLIGLELFLKNSLQYYTLSSTTMSSHRLPLRNKAFTPKEDKDTYVRIIDL